MHSNTINEQATSKKNKVGHDIIPDLHRLLLTVRESIIYMIAEENLSYVLIVERPLCKQYLNILHIILIYIFFSARAARKTFSDKRDNGLIVLSVT